jgi:hypothetical protein
VHHQSKEAGTTLAMISRLVLSTHPLCCEDYQVRQNAGGAKPVLM